MTTANETFTDQEFAVIFAVVYSHLPIKDMAQQLGITHQAAKSTMISIYDKANVCTRLQLFEFVKAALNNELRAPARRVVMADITERDRQAAKSMILAYDLNPSDEDKIAARLAEMIADGNIGRFLDYLRELGAKVKTKLPLD